MPILAHTVTLPGTRNSINQDSLGLRVAQTSLGEVAFAILCDGMGGLSQGEVASATAVAAFLEWFDRRLPYLIRQGLSPQTVSEEWAALAVQVNQAVYDYAKRENARIGTTLTALLLTPKQYYLLSLGDTRAYVLSRRIKQLSEDQTLLAKEVPAFRITAEQLNEDPRASVLLQCVGASPKVRPQVVSGKTVPHATYILCSDGLYRTVPSGDLQRLLKPAALPDQAAIEEGVGRLLAQNQTYADRDDTSLIVIRL